MQCLGRIAKVDGILHFADGRQRFYLPYRCTNMCLPDSNCCSRCTGRTADKIQSSGKYDHGLCNGAIPDHSHMYGGAWYHAKYAKLSLSPMIRKQVDDHYAAYMMMVPVDPIAETLSEALIAETPIAEALSEAPIVALQNEIVTPKRRGKNKTIIIDTEPAVHPQKRKSALKPATSKPVTSKPVEAPVHIEATHIERDTEEIFADDYEIEYIKLSPFDHDGATYLREPNKNKLFQKRSNGVGDYIGRYDTYTETIRTDIPDSDKD